MIHALLWIALGAVICGVIVAIVHNVRNHPGKVEAEAAKVEQAAKDLRS